MITVEGGSRAAAPEGSMTYAFTHTGNFLLLLIAIGSWALELRFGRQGWKLASRLDLGLEARIWAFQIQFGPRD